MDIRNKYKVVYIINQYFFDYFLENRKIIRTKKSEYPNGHSDILIYSFNYIKLFASARISSPIASAASCVGPSE